MFCVRGKIFNFEGFGYSKLVRCQCVTGVVMEHKGRVSELSCLLNVRLGFKALLSSGSFVFTLGRRTSGNLTEKLGGDEGSCLYCKKETLSDLLLM